MTTQLSLQNKSHLASLLPNSQLLDHLPYIDDDVSQLKGRIMYMIKDEQEKSLKDKNPYEYIEQLKLPNLEFVNSEKFMKEVERVKGKIEGLNNAKKNKLSVNIQVDEQKLNKGKLPVQSLKSLQKQISGLYNTYQQQILKNLSIQQAKQFSPMLMKQWIQSLETSKSQLQQKIATQKQQIEELNRLRKYEQLQAREKQEVIEQRIKVMLNKRRKIE